MVHFGINHQDLILPYDDDLHKNTKSGFEVGAGGGNKNKKKTVISVFSNYNTSVPPNTMV